MSPTIGRGNGNPLQYSCLENPMDRGAWRATAHGVVKSRTRLSVQYYTPRYCDSGSSISPCSSVSSASPGLMLYCEVNTC